jgi:hypothetical protein
MTERPGGAGGAGRRSAPLSAPANPAACRRSAAGKRAAGAPAGETTRRDSEAPRHCRTDVPANPSPRHVAFKLGVGCRRDSDLPRLLPLSRAKCGYLGTLPPIDRQRPGPGQSSPRPVRHPRPLPATLTGSASRTGPAPRKTRTARDPPDPDRPGSVRPGPAALPGPAAHAVSPGRGSGRLRQLLPDSARRSRTPWPQRRREHERRAGRVGGGGRTVRVLQSSASGPSVRRRGRHARVATVRPMEPSRGRRRSVLAPRAPRPSYGALVVGAPAPRAPRRPCQPGGGGGGSGGLTRPVAGRIGWRRR